MTTYLCWHLPDGSPERADEVQAATAQEAACDFAETFFHDSKGEWMGGGVMVQPLDAALDGIGDPTRFDTDIALEDLTITANPAS